jgi:hypothetical protein
MPTAITASTTINQASLANGPFTITGGSSINAPVIINITANLTLVSASNLFTSASGYWILNGNGYTITVSGVTEFQGLFNSINNGGTVENLAVNAASSTLAANTGSIAATNNGLIDHVSSNFAASASCSGGIVHTMSSSGAVSNSYTTGAISGMHAGGIVGGNAGISNLGSISNCYSSGAISGMYAGGIVGDNNFGTIVNSYSTGVIAGIYNGGIAGFHNQGTILNSYSTGAIIGDYAGGIAGTYNTGTITNSYSTGVVTGFVAGGINGYNSGSATVNNSQSTPSGWSDTTANTALSGLGTIWNDSNPNLTTPYSLVSAPGVFTPSAPPAGTGIIGNNPWAGNLLQIWMIDSTLNSGAGFYADQAAQYGFGGLYGSPSQNSFQATYQWYANGVAINGANAATFVVPGSVLGKAITVQVSYTNGLGYAYANVQSAGVTVNGISDRAENVSTYLDSIQANHVAISAALSSAGQFSIYDGSNTPVTATVAQLTSAIDAISLIKAGTDYFGNHYLVGVADTAAHISSGIDVLITNALAGKIDDLLITDSGVVAMSPSQASSLASLASNYGIDLTGYQLGGDVLVNQASDGTVYIKSGGNLITCSASGLVFFSDGFTTGSGVIANIAAQYFAPLYQSSGGINGYTLPDLFTGPSSLNLTYQLIESAQNAVVTGSSSNEFIKVANSNSIGKAVNGNGGSDVIDGGEGSTFVTGGANHSSIFFLDGRAPGESWSTVTDFQPGIDKITIWGFVKGVSYIDTRFTDFNNEGATGYTGLTLHFLNLLPDGQTSGTNPIYNSITLTGHTLQEFGVNSLAELNTQINNDTNNHIVVGATQDALGTHSYLHFY